MGQSAVVAVYAPAWPTTCGSGSSPTTRRASTSTEGRRISCGKANLGPLPEPFGFTITDDGLTFGPPPEEHQQASRLDEAKAFLRRALADGPRPANEVKDEAKEKGISQDTLRRAKESLCRSWRAAGTRYGWTWSLREAQTDAQDERLDHLVLGNAS